MHRLRDLGRAFESSEEIGRLHHHRSRRGIERGFEAGEIKLARFLVRELHKLGALLADECIQDLVVLRMHGAGHQDAVAARDAQGHQNGLSRGRGAIVKRRVAHLHAGELRHQGLEFKHRLQRALGNFRLIRRVSGEEFASRK